MSKNQHTMMKIRTATKQITKIERGKRIWGEKGGKKEKKKGRINETEDKKFRMINQGKGKVEN